MLVTILLIGSSYDTKFAQNGLEWKTKEDNEVMDEKRIAFLGGVGASFRDQTPHDALLIAQDDGPTVPVHKALLAIVSLSLILLLLYLLIASKH